MADINVVVSQSNNATPTVSTQATVLAANVNRVGFTIQNAGTNPLYLLFASGTASSTQYHIALQACTALSDGKGGIVSMTSGVVYQGIISSGGTGAQYTVWEI